MKRLVLTFAAFVALFTTVQSAKADWVIEVNGGGWIVFRWDPAFDDGDYYPPPPPPPLPYVVPPVYYNIAGVYYLFAYTE